jgi:hydrogenase nickel incorporation protein HypA/HybF
MHEVAIAEEIKNVVIQKLNENKGKKVKAIKLLIGEMTSIVPEALKFALDVVSKDTPMANASIHIKVLKAKALCRNCSKKFKINDYNFICPACHSFDVEIRQGREMIIQTIEMEI